MRILELGVLPLLCYSLLHFLTKAEGQLYVYRNTATNYSSGSVFQKNLKFVLLPSLVASASSTGLNMITAGQDPDVVYGLIQCRPDISKGGCQACSRISAVEIN